MWQGKYNLVSNSFGVPFETNLTFPLCSIIKKKNKTIVSAHCENFHTSVLCLHYCKPFLLSSVTLSYHSTPLPVVFPTRACLLSGPRLQTSIFYIEEKKWHLSFLCLGYFTYYADFVSTSLQTTQFYYLLWPTPLHCMCMAHSSVLSSVDKQDRRPGWL